MIIKRDILWLYAFIISTIYFYALTKNCLGRSFQYEKLLFQLTVIARELLRHVNDDTQNGICL